LNDLIQTIVLTVLTAVPAITLHEAAHGYAALAMGDDTARRAGRLSLNPLVHVDRVGTFLFPGFLLIVQLLTIHRVAFMFGWAKPVPVDPWRFRDPRRGMMVVAAAGPAMNFLLVWLTVLVLHATPMLGMGRAREVALQLCSLFIVYNLILGLFNLLPIPPLDGGRIIVGLLPEAAARVWARLERAGIAVVLLLVFILPQALREAGIAFDPLGSLLTTVGLPALRLFLYLGGSPPDGLVLLGYGSDV
jgi:Zn-dependent protease